MNFQEQLVKSFNYNPTLSAPELSQAITESAYNTSSLLAEVGQHFTDNPTYRNVFVTHPTISDVAEGDVIPPSTVQSYTTTAAAFSKFASSIELTNEVLTISKFDIESNTAMLVGNVLANRVAEFVTEDIATRYVTAAPTTEQVLELKSGIANEWGSDALATYQFIAEALKNVPDVYDANSKLFCNKNNFIDFSSLTQSSAQGGDQVWLIQNGLLLGRYEIVICDQLDDNTMYFGDMNAAFDLVAMSGNQTVDPYTKPDTLKITETSKFALVGKDTGALVALTATV